MKKFCAVFLIFLLTVPLFSDDDEKQKLAVMEFEDLSGKLPPEMLAGATEYIRGAFVSSNKFIVIAKERQENAMIKEMKKESYKSCNDKNCQIPLGQALSADTILRTTINFFGGIYTITSELIDLAKEATIIGAKQNFDGTERSLMEALDRIVVQIAGATVSYKVEEMKAQEIKGVSIGGVELSTMPKIEMKETNFSNVNTNFSVGELDKSSVGVSLDADADVLVQYDNCVQTDKKAENSPFLAINCWEKLAAMKQNNPFLEQAEKRVIEWKKFEKSKKLSEIFEKAKTADKSGQIFLYDAIEAWRELARDPNDNPYYQTAVERFNFWKQYEAQVSGYKSQLKQFEAKHKEDTEKLRKVIPLSVINTNQKRTILVQYMEIYAPFYGIEDVSNLINSFNTELAQELYGLVFNDFLKKEMSEKCEQGKGASCYILATLTEVEDPQKAAVFYEKSCNKGIVNACVKTGKSYYDNNRKKDAAKLFYDACGMESPEGCHLAGYVTETGAGVEQNAELAQKIYKKACSFGYTASCNINVKPSVYSSSSPRRDRGASAVRSSNHSDSGYSHPSDSSAKKQTYHPYKGAGITLIVIGAVIGAGGVAAFHILSDKEYKEYKEYTYYSNAFSAVYAGMYYDDYLHKANKHRKKSNTYRTIEITSGAAGGALILTGIVFAAIKKEKTQNTAFTNFSVMPSKDGLYASVGFEF